MANSTASSLKEYLKKYETSNNEDENKKKKKKKKSKPTRGGATDSRGVLIVDEDPVWQKPVNIEQDDEGDDDDSPDERPQVDEDIEVKRMKRMELLRARRPYHAISEDGSGWVSVSNEETMAITDISPPRRTRRFDTPSPSPQPENMDDEDDLSPPRQRRKRFDSPSPEPGQIRLNSVGITDRDLSPPRPPRKDMVDRSESPDLSPPRRRVQRGDSADRSDMSPPRRSRSHNDTERLPRSPDLSPPRRVRKGDSDDMPPPRRISRVSSTDDLSPPRKSKKTTEARSGLFSAQEIKKEIDRKLKEELARYKELDPSVSGRGAEPVYRDKEGKRISKEDALKLQKKKEEEKPKEKKLEWGKGLAQKREAEATQQELELEKDKPFARTRDDPELDKMFKERLRWGDPMAHLVKGKHSDMILEDLGDDERMKESGFIIPQDIPTHSWIKRRLDAPPNRYGIKPGRHWDGVDRSNGTEKEYFKRKSDKQATEREAYLWSVSDM